MAKKKYNDGIDRDRLIAERGARTALKKALAERMLNTEMDVHLSVDDEQAAALSV